jgi:hypothetical protein
MNGKTVLQSASPFVYDKITAKHAKKMLHVGIVLAAAFVLTVITGLLFHATSMKHWGLAHAITGMICIVLVVQQVQVLSRFLYHRMKNPYRKQES